jgi:hypothetical protein
MDYITEPFPGHNEDIQLQEYEKIKDVVNENHNCDMSALEVRSEFEQAYNKIFESLLVDHSHEIFNIIYVLMDEFNISEMKAVRYLYPENKEKVRAFAINKCNTSYYEKIEKKLEKEKVEKKGGVYSSHKNISDLFS